MRGAVCIIAALCLAVWLAACDTPQDFEIREHKAEQRNKELESRLPEGCKVYYAGEYTVADKGGVTSYYPVVVVQCDKKKATTTNSTYRVGKTTESVATVVVED